ncbi:unnamed protein product [Ectocarpus fasciculatus]
MTTPESKAAGLAFQPRADDIFIVTYPKCGTTWVSFIAHCLRTRGSTDFGEITEVVPWTICAGDCGQDLNAEQVASPRLYKSHEDYGDVPKGGKFIYVVRSPEDVCLSFYNFLLSYAQVDPGSVSIEDFVTHLFAGQGSNSGRIWEHYLSFYERRDDPNVLWLFYENLLSNPDREIEKIANFMNVDLDGELREMTLSQSSMAYMKGIASKFDDHFVFDACKLRMGFSEDAKVSVGKVHKGVANAGKAALSPAILQTLKDEWEKVR